MGPKIGQLKQKLNNIEDAQWKRDWHISSTVYRHGTGIWYRLVVKAPVDPRGGMWDLNSLKQQVGNSYTILGNSHSILGKLLQQKGIQTAGSEIQAS